MTTPLHILLGDDLFEEGRGTIIDLSVIISGMEKITGLSTGQYRPEQIGPKLYHHQQLPLPGLPSAEFKIALTVEEMIQYAKSQPWDWIVTDLEYGREDVDGGIRVIQALQDVKSVKAIFTGSDDRRRIKELQSLPGMDYLIAPFLAENNTQFYGKFQILGKVMAEYSEFR